MRRRASRRQPIGISLFPFLAVLICTMGVIIVMLVIVVRQASQRAHAEIANAQTEVTERDAARQAAADAERKKRREAVEDAEWQNDILAKQRETKAEELTKMRQMAAHVEDHLRRLQEEADKLLAQAQDIDDGKKLSDDELEAAKREVAKIKAEIAKSKLELDELKKKTTEKQRWFALIPYEGPNGTRRRPIYIECTEVGITLQPEGVTLIADDFNGPLGPGNPLDAALRAKREYMERNGEKGLPYPLLIVRPDGIVAYAVARSALKSWDEEFGYELIDAEKKLSFGEGDPNLAKMMEATVRTARSRQAQRAVAMPRRYQPEDNLGSFRPQEAVASAPEVQMARGLGGGRNGNGGIGATPGGTGNGLGPGGTSLAGAGPYGANPTGTGTSAGQPQGGIGSGGSGNGGLGNGPGISYATPTGTKPGGTNGPGGKPGEFNGAAGGGSSTAGGNATGANNVFTANSVRGGQNATGGAGVAGGVAGGPNASGSGEAPQGVTGSAQSSGGKSGGQSGGSSGSDSADGQAGMTANASKKSSADSAKNANRRGSNWGLPNAQNHTVAVTRPIRIACLADRLVVLPDKGDNNVAPKNVRFHGEEMTVEELDAFVGAVQKQMQGWGLAVSNGYWKPVLSVDVSPNAEHRYEELQTALRNSGIDVQRKVR